MALVTAVLPNNSLSGSPAAKAGIYTSVFNKNIKLCNLSIGSQWQVALYTLQGQTVLNTRGVANAKETMVSTAHLQPGVYVNVLKSAGQVFKSVVTIKQ
jgi:hypothetical protein